MTKVKICGLKRKEDIEFANILLPEYAGFVFAASPRQVSAEQAAKLRAELDLRVRTVGVFVKKILILSKGWRQNALLMWCSCTVTKVRSIAGSCAVK